MNDQPMIPAPTAEALSAYPEGCWPLCSHLRLPAVADAIPSARHHARRVLAEWHQDSDVAELIVCELVTNAVRASVGRMPGMIRLWLCAGLDGTVLVQVWDCCEQLPVRCDAGPRADHGRGLLIVDALSKDWGAYRPAALPGKIVWSVITG